MQRFISLGLFTLLILISLTSCDNSSSFDHIKPATTKDPLSTPEQNLTPESQKVVIFKDQNLESFIKNTLKIRDSVIRVADMESLRRLEIEGSDITDLTGLEYASNLYYISLSNCHIKSIDPLVSLKTIRTLSLFEVTIDKMPLEVNWPTFTTFTVHHSKLPTIEFLLSVSSLDNFEYVSSSLNDLSPIQNNLHLKILTIDDNAVSDLSPLTALTLLTRLDLTMNNIKSIEVLRNHEFINRIDLSHNPITDLSPLLQWPRLNFMTLFDPNNDLLNQEQLEYLQEEGVTIEYLKK